MLPLNLTLVDATIPLVGPVALPQQVGSVQTVGSVQNTTAAGQRFSATLNQALAVESIQPANPVQLAQVVNPAAPTTAVNPAGPATTVTPARSSTAVDAGVGATNDASAEQRARRALQLDSGTPADQSGSGDVILDGLQKLRGAFDAQQSRLSAMISEPATDINTLFAVQFELTNYSMLVDMTSKLTGKSTQAFDTLLKGQ
jgi:hypothetical protein